MTPYLCPACQNRLNKGDIHKDYKCAFNEKGEFVTPNWRCATLNLIVDLGEDVYGNDQMVSLLSHPDEIDMVTLSRYKRHGACDQAVILDSDPRPVKALTLETAIAFLQPRRHNQGTKFLKDLYADKKLSTPKEKIETLRKTIIKGEVLLPPTDDEEDELAMLEFYALLQANLLEDPK